MLICDSDGSRLSGGETGVREGSTPKQAAGTGKRADAPSHGACCRSFQPATATATATATDLMAALMTTTTTQSSVSECNYEHVLIMFVM